VASPKIDELERRKRSSTIQLLFKVSRLVNERAVARARERGGTSEMRVAHTSLLPHIDWEGTRLSELARRLGVSKQAVGQLVDELEQMGTCERVADPTDGRAKLVRFSSRGKRQILDGLNVLDELEREFAPQLGKRRMLELRRTLELWLEALEATDAGQSH